MSKKYRHTIFISSEAEWIIFDMNYKIVSFVDRYHHLGCHSDRLALTALYILGIKFRLRVQFSFTLGLRFELHFRSPLAVALTDWDKMKEKQWFRLEFDS